MPATNKVLPKRQPGDIIKADEWNTVARQVNSLSNLGHGFNAIVNGAGMFLTGGSASGATVLPIKLGKTTIAHDKGATETVDLYSGDTKGSETATGDTEQVYNRFGDIESGKWVLIVYIGNGWELIAAEC